ncbi:hypothetical protein GQX74_003275 [Glossina fuscipes]|nr:hypothetical protein GQX74_003275 [Glossina fuscipes]
MLNYSVHYRDSFMVLRTGEGFTSPVLLSAVRLAKVVGAEMVFALFNEFISLALLLRDMDVPPFNGLTDRIAVAAGVATADKLLLSDLSLLLFSSLIDIDDGVRCMDSETGIVVITSLVSKPEAVVVMVGICVVAIGKIFNVAAVSVELVVKGNDSVVMFEVTGIAV